MDYLSDISHKARGYLVDIGAIKYVSKKATFDDLTRS